MSPPNPTDRLDAAPKSDATGLYPGDRINDKAWYKGFWLQSWRPRQYPD